MEEYLVEISTVVVAIFVVFCFIFTLRVVAPALV